MATSEQDQAEVAPQASRPSVTALRDELRHAIVTCRLAPGAEATQMQLAEQFGVSRTPLREALRMLELEGLIVREPNGRFRIAELSLDDIEQLCVIRMSLETAAVWITVPLLTNTDHAELEGLLAQVDRYALVGDWEGFEGPHRAFHMKITSGVGPSYSEQVARLFVHGTRYRQAYARIVSARGRYAVSQAEHRAMLDAIEAYEPAPAAGLVAIQYARTALEIAAEVDPEHPMDKVRTILAVHTGSRELPAT
jgi:DNA-binding GntR family transcriptional regulator